MSKILIIEDEEVTAFALELFCQKLGYTVLETVNHYDAAIQSIIQNHPDLLLCDIELNEIKSGLDIAKVAQDTYNIPSIFLTAYYDNEILKQAKHIDFYGYILKPYKEQELEATLKLAFNQIRKNQPYTKRYIEIGHYIFDMKTKKLFDDLKEIILSKKAQRLLYFLLLHPNECKQYHEIIDYVYEGDTVSLDTLRQLVRRTRQYFNDDYIKASRNIGYSLAI